MESAWNMLKFSVSHFCSLHSKHTLIGFNLLYNELYIFCHVSLCKFCVLCVRRERERDLQTVCAQSHTLKLFHLSINQGLISLYVPQPLSFAHQRTAYAERHFYTRLKLLHLKHLCRT